MEIVAFLVFLTIPVGVVMFAVWEWRELPRWTVCRVRCGTYRRRGKVRGVVASYGTCVDSSR